ncbi:MAG: flagellar motor switch protein FliM [Phycisphaerae bacterium]|nr:flagellar motor switch protein FliM [Phycisphaerae bacterium]MBN8598020.1 flagellar motor switch protein FliM [Planctomycetota bacterium]
MADVLNQSEVDALLAAVDTGTVEQEQRSVTIFSRHRDTTEGLEVKAYDFKRPERVSKDQMRSLQTLHESFARNFGASLSGFLRTIVEVKVATCEQMTYSEFIAGLPNPTSFNLIKADALEGQICLEISPLIIYPIIDRLLGGTSHDLFIPQRPLTLIETRLIGNVTTRGLATLSEAWSSVKKMSFSIAATESNPQLVQIVPPNEVVVVIGFELKMSNRAGTMNLCIPYNVIEPVMEELSAQSWFTSTKNQHSTEIEQTVASTLGRASLQVTGVLAETTISLRDLLLMAPGDLLVTEKRADQPVVVCVEDEKKFLARVGCCRGNKALRIDRAIATGDRV